jgi:hypothetical protein
MTAALLRLQSAPSAIMCPVTTPIRSTRSDRLLAAVAHLGVPFASVGPSLAIWSSTAAGSHPRTHARRAFSYQCLYLVFHVAFTVVMALTGDPVPLLICLAVGFLLELPQVALALVGRPPLPVPPFLLLKP